MLPVRVPLAVEVVQKAPQLCCMPLCCTL
jgi:hypothetical protein